MDSREWTNMIWQQIDTNVLSITLHQEQALLLLQSSAKRMCIPFQIGWKNTKLTAIFIFIFRQVTLFIHGIFFRFFRFFRFSPFMP